MRITTLGTSHGDATYCRFNSSTLIETSGGSYLLDCGEPATALMVRQQKDAGALRAVFITHMHGDHAFGLPALMKMLVKYAREGQHTDLFLAEEGAAESLSGWLSACHVPWPSPVVTARVTRPGPIFDDGVMSVTAQATRHLRDADRPGVPLSFAYVLQAEDKRLVYTGDLSADFSDFPAAARRTECDLCICEVTHYQPEAALPILMQSPIKRLVLNHVHNPWHGEGEKVLLDMMRQLPYPVEVAHDGDVFTL